MAILDNVSRNNILLSNVVAIAADGTTVGSIINTADYDNGISFYIAAPIYTDGTYKLLLTEGEDPALADGVVVIDDKLILSDTLDAVNDGVTQMTPADGKMFKVGIFSNKTYLRADIVATNVTTGATVSVVTLVSPEVLAAS